MDLTLSTLPRHVAVTVPPSVWNEAERDGVLVVRGGLEGGEVGPGAGPGGGRGDGVRGDTAGDRGAGAPAPAGSCGTGAGEEDATGADGPLGRTVVGDAEDADVADDPVVEDGCRATASSAVAADLRCPTTPGPASGWPRPRLALLTAAKVRADAITTTPIHPSAMTTS
ncbi:hypothetical protein V3N99_06840 [Dermatophilaceae bacterium Soc4.6]